MSFRKPVDNPQGPVEERWHLVEEEIDHVELVAEEEDDLVVEELGQERVWQLAGPS